MTRSEPTSACEQALTEMTHAHCADTEPATDLQLANGLHGPFNVSAE